MPRIYPGSENRAHFTHASGKPGKSRFLQIPHGKPHIAHHLKIERHHEKIMRKAQAILDSESRFTIKFLRTPSQQRAASRLGGEVTITTYASNTPERQHEALAKRNKTLNLIFNSLDTLGKLNELVQPIFDSNSALILMFPISSSDTE